VLNRGWNRRAESRGVGTAARVGGRSKLWKDTIGLEIKLCEIPLKMQPQRFVNSEGAILGKIGID
jgi:hypothetical protein